MNTMPQHIRNLLCGTLAIICTYTWDETPKHTNSSWWCGSAGTAPLYGTTSRPVRCFRGPSPPCLLLQSTAEGPVPHEEGVDVDLPEMNHP